MSAAVVLERTSGDERDGQDVAAACRQTVARAEAAGFDVEATFEEPDVSGDTPWQERPGLQNAASMCAATGAVLVVREPSRLWRGDPARGLLQIRTLPDLEVLGRDHWRRRGGEWVGGDDTAELIRFIDLWEAWRELRRDADRTRLAMADLKHGRRETRSGKAVGRPTVEIPADQLAAARAVLDAGGSMAGAHREVQRLRGVFDAKDPRTVKARAVSKAKLGEALGLYVPSSVRKANASEIGKRAGGDLSNGNGSLADKNETNETGA